MTVSRTTLPSGLRIVTEEVPTVRSVAFGIWANVGSRDESPAVAGASHFLEHLLFKGTTTRSALDISAAIDAVGGEMNAFTGKEYTCFYARVIDRDFAIAAEVICDMIRDSVIRSEDIDSERTVVLEEIAMRDDDPSDLVHDLFSETLYGDTPIGRPILGTVDSITNMSRRSVNDYYKKKYLPENLVVAVAGNVTHERVVAQVSKLLGDFLDSSAKPAALRPTSKVKARGLGDIGLIYRKSEQANILLGFPSIDRNDERRFALSVLTSALGGGMSSRLFQEVREKRGLAYSVYASMQQFAGAGILSLYAGCNPASSQEVTSIFRDVLGDVVTSGLTDEELERAKGQVAGSMVLGQEDTGSRMVRIGKSELVYGEIKSMDEILASVRAVDQTHIAQLATEIFTAQPTLAVVGPYKKSTSFASAVAK
ncbi:MAG: insulinase family protein [Actinobacteria bacterium]|uniref:Insulinase family protein n=1 Tax=Candidatus Fonsibacter lacus TaxID=2576439 RepID=A0A965LL34_9PROT|nr:insulinase family protein [Candidatus Fonsibacter lacus]